MIHSNDFKNPPKEYSIVPFWFWNDDLNKEHLKWQIDEMFQKNIYEFIIHARKGLEVEYLSESWFDKIGFILEKAREKGMKVWIYDEDNFPSGYAGGRVLQINPDYCGKHLKMEKRFLHDLLNEDVSAHSYDSKAEKVVCILAEEDNKYIDVTQMVIQKKYSCVKNTDMKVFVFKQAYTLWNPAYTDSYYVDVLNRNATDAFIRYTHEEYKTRFDDYFGSILKGFFSDEAGFYNNLTMFEHMKDGNTVPWTDEFQDFFLERNGYSILENLPYIWINNQAYSRKIRYDFYETLCEMYKTNFLEPQRGFCESNNLVLIGHLHMEDYLHLQIVTQGDMTRALDSLSYAGTDRIDRNTEKINEKLISSIGHIYGKKRVMSETYGTFGWGVTMQEMKRWVDWQYVRGINMLVPHAFYSSIEGDRKFECPPSQFYQNPYWKYYSCFADYVARLSYLLSSGRHVADIAVYYPMTTAYELIAPDRWEGVIETDKFLQEIAFSLLENQYDFDFINDESLQKSFVLKSEIIIEEERYKVLLVPASTNLLFNTLKKIKEFVENGVTVVFIKYLPDKCVEIEKQKEFAGMFKELFKMKNVYFIEERSINKPYTYCFDIEPLKVMLQKHTEKDFILEKHDSNIKYLHRKSSNRDIYFIVNEDDSCRKNIVRFRMKGTPKEWKINSGEVTAIKDYTIEDEYIIIPLEFEEYGSKLIVFDDEVEVPVKQFMCENGMYIDRNGKQVVLDSIPAPYYIGGKWDINIAGKNINTSLCSWHRLGFPHFSGEAIYKTEFELNENYKGYRCKLELGEVKECAEVWINDEYAGCCIWSPYCMDITSKISIGKNRLRINVVNSLANEIEKVPNKSGLFGPVRIVFIHKYDG